MEVFILQDISSENVKNNYNLSIPFDLKKDTTYVIDSAYATGLINDGYAKLSESESVVLGQLYQPKTNPTNPFNDIEHPPTDIQPE